MPGDDTKWMTYAELADAFGIGADSARNLVRRKRWPRKAGNDGLMRIGVPVDSIKTPVNPPADGASVAPIDPPIETAAVAALERHIERLERDLSAAVAERDVERARAAQVGVLTAVLDIERQRGADLRQDRDRWQAAAVEPRGVLAWLRRRA